jgi:hypothetical protein
MRTLYREGKITTIMNDIYSTKFYLMKNDLYIQFFIYGTRRNK